MASDEDVLAASSQLMKRNKHVYKELSNERIDIASDKSKFVEVYIMRVMISIILMVIAALVGFFFGAGMNEAMGGAILLSMITGFACTISAIEKNKKE